MRKSCEILYTQFLSKRILNSNHRGPTAYYFASEPSYVLRTRNKKGAPALPRRLIFSGLSRSSRSKSSLPTALRNCRARR